MRFGSQLSESALRLHSSELATEANRGEFVLAIARLMVALGVLGAIRLDSSLPVRGSGPLQIVSASYVLFSAVVLVIVRASRGKITVLPLVAHGVNILCPVLFSLLAGGVRTPFLIMLLFVMMAAAYRWGLKQTLATAAASILLFLAAWGITPLVGRHTWWWPHEQPHFTKLGSDFLCIGVLCLIFGYLAENQKRLRKRTLAISQMVCQAQPESGLRESLEGSLRSLLELFSARHITLLLRDASDPQAFLWEAHRAEKPEETTVERSRVTPSAGRELFFSVPQHNWCAVGVRRNGHRQRNRFLLLGDLGEPLRPETGFFEQAAFTRIGSGSLMGVSFALQDGWLGCLVLFDPRGDSCSEAELGFLQEIVRDVARSIHSVYLLRRLRSRIQAAERARVARELHDSVLQSVITAEMEVSVLRRKCANESCRIAESLARVEARLHAEAADLRETMERLRPQQVDPRQLLASLADIVTTFRYETGISASFASDGEGVELPPRVCREIGRIVQEALFNVRKHSGARRVLVRFLKEQGLSKLIIEDDGQGFPFSGRLSLDELDAIGAGPRVIKERVRSIGAALTVDSAPGRGAHLEIAFP